VQRVAVIARLKPDRAAEAAELIAKGPPFDPRAAGFERHIVFLAPDEVVFVFEGASLGPLVRFLSEASDPSVLGSWEPLLEGMPRVAREAYVWVRPAEPFGAGWGE
jgi:hypothetical protein